VSLCLIFLEKTIFYLFMKMIDAERIIAPHLEEKKFHITQTWPVGAWGAEASILVGYMYLVIASLIPEVPTGDWILEFLYGWLILINVILFGVMMAMGVGSKLTKSYSQESEWLGLSNIKADKDGDLGVTTLLKERASQLEKKYHSSGWMLSIMPVVQKSQLEAMKYGIAAILLSQCLASIIDASHWVLAVTAVLTRSCILIQMSTIREYALKSWESLHTSNLWD